MIWSNKFWCASVLSNIVVKRGMMSLRISFVPSTIIIYHEFRQHNTHVISTFHERGWLRLFIFSFCCFFFHCSIWLYIFGTGKGAASFGMWWLFSSKWSLVFDIIWWVKLYEGMFSRVTLFTFRDRWTNVFLRIIIKFFRRENVLMENSRNVSLWILKA